MDVRLTTTLHKVDLSLNIIQSMMQYSFFRPMHNAVLGQLIDKSSLPALKKNKDKKIRLFKADLLVYKSYFVKLKTTDSPAITSPDFFSIDEISSMLEITTGVKTDFAFDSNVAKSNSITVSPRFTL